MNAIDALRLRAVEGLAGGGVEVVVKRHDPVRRRAGHQAHDHGAAFESWLSGQHRAARLARLAHVRKVGAPVFVGPGGLPAGWAGTGPADYQGVLAGGRALALEAKSVEARLSRADIPGHQQRDLEDVAAMGGLALLAVELRDAHMIAIVRWTDAPWRRCERAKPGRAGSKRPEDVIITETLGAEELAPWAVGNELYITRFTEVSRGR